MKSNIVFPPPPRKLRKDELYCYDTNKISRPKWLRELKSL